MAQNYNPFFLVKAVDCSYFPVNAFTADGTKLVKNAV